MVPTATSLRYRRHATELAMDHAKPLVRGVRVIVPGRVPGLVTGHAAALAAVPAADTSCLRVGRLLRQKAAIVVEE